DSVMDRFSRPDMVDKITSRFPRALQSAHSTNDFRRDVKTLNVIDPLVIGGISSIQVTSDLPRLRKVLSLATYSNYEINGLITTPTNPHLIAFKDRTLGEFNYYGYEYPQTWMLAGNTLNLTGVEGNTRAIGVMGIFFPNYTFDALK